MDNLKGRPFAQVDVFTTSPYKGNPVAVVLDGEGISDEAMARFAKWTNLSETTFVLPPTNPAADYRLRIFSPGTELPFAGHPTLGSAHAWFEMGGVPKKPGVIVQECEIGLIEIRQNNGVFAFRAPELLRTGPLDESIVTAIAKGLCIDRGAIIGHQWVDNGPRWMAVQLESAEAVLALQPNPQDMAEFNLGVVGAYPAGSQHAFEVRAFVYSVGIPEDPVTGSVNAGIAQWLISAGIAPDKYTVGQGKRVGRDGTVSIELRDDEVWVGGACATCISGSVHI